MTSANHRAECPGGPHEAHLPTFPRQAEALPRISSTHVNQGRTQRPGSSSREGPQAPCRDHSQQASLISRYGFPKSFRLLVSPDFRRVQRGRRFKTKHLVFRCLKSEASEPRIGLAVSRKVGNAVVRNRVKRWIREAVRHERQVLTGMEVVVIALPSASRSSAASIRSQVARVFADLRERS